MPLPTQPPITWDQICAEFGVPVSTNAHQMLRGAGIVPNIAANAGVPTALPLEALHFLGAQMAAPFSAWADSPQLEGRYHCQGTAGQCPVSNLIGTPTVNILASGGSGATTYEWSHVAGTVCNVSHPSSGSTWFSAQVARQSAVSSVYRCKVTRGGEVVYVDVNILITYDYTPASEDGTPI